MLTFIASSGFWSLGILAFGLSAMVCLARSFNGNKRLQQLGLHLSIISVLIGITGTSIGIYKHHSIVATKAVDEQIEILATVLGLTLSAVGLACALAAINGLLYAMVSWRNFEP